MDSQSALSQSEFERYARHLSLPQIGLSGQQKLKQSRVTIIGCGGLGAPASLYLAAAGVGTIHLIDDDTVALSNLQRQITFTESDIGQPKAEVTRKTLLARNSSIQVKALPQRLNKENALSLLRGSDIVLDCCDNTESRYLINQCCRDLGIPWVYASIFQFSGQCALFTPDGPCFRCVFPEANAQLANCNEAGVIGVLPGIIGSLQTITAIKHLLSLTPAKSTELILFETLDIGLRCIDVERREDCTTCNQTNHSTSIDTQLPEETTEPMPSPIIHADELKDLLEKDAVVLIDVREREEHAHQNLGGLNIPLRELQNTALPTDRPIVFYCQMGARSLTAQQWASGVAGFDDALSLEGGISRALSERSID